MMPVILKLIELARVVMPVLDFIRWAKRDKGKCNDESKSDAKGDS